MSDDNAVLAQQIYSLFTAGEGITGEIDSARLATQFASMGIYLSEELLEDIIEYATEGAAGTMNFKQFKKVIDSITLEAGEDPTKENYTPEAKGSDAMQRSAKLAFQVFDRDEDRKLSIDDLRDTLVDHEYAGTADEIFADAARLTDADVQAINFAVDPASGGESISRAAFHAMFNDAGGKKAAAKKSAAAAAAAAAEGEGEGEEAAHE